MRRLYVTLLVLILLVACKSKLVRNAEAFIEAKEYGKAVELLRIELQANPTNVNAYILLGKVELLRGNDHAAEQAFDKAVLLDTSAKTQVADAYMTALQAVTQNPDHARSWERFITYARRAITLDNRGKEIRTWSLQHAEARARSERTTIPLLHLRALLDVDLEARADVAAAYLRTARHYLEKGFTHEALLYATAAGELGEGKAAATIIKAAALTYPRGDAFATGFLRRAADEWDTTLRNDQDVVRYLTPDEQPIVHEERAREGTPGRSTITTAAVLPQAPVPTTTIDPYVRVGGEVRPPKVQTRVPPLYPEEAKQAGIHGTVILEVQINTFGDVTDLRILRDLPYGLGKHALDAVQHWRFTPATRHGKPVACTYNVAVSFNPDTRESPPSVIPPDDIAFRPGELLGQWNFANDTQDHSGNRVRTVNHGATLTKDGITLTSGPDYVDLGTTLDTAPFSISFWIKPEKRHGVARIISNWSEAGGFDIHYNTTEMRPLTFRLYQGSNGVASATTPLTYGAWQHITCTWDGRTARIYKDADMMREDEATNRPAPSRTTIKLGMLGNGQNRHEDYDGQLDDLLIVRRALSPGEIRTLAAQGRPPAD